MVDEAVRIDKWLWAVRLFKTRAAAKEACGSGRVRVQASVAKPAQRVRVGDEITVRSRAVTRSYRVKAVIDKRVGAGVAAECFEDLTPPQPGERDSPSGGDRVDAAWAERARGTGRPTKRDRRQMEKFLGHPRD